jgi:hypothetical protein
MIKGMLFFIGCLCFVSCKTKVLVTDQSIVKPVEKIIVEKKLDYIPYYLKMYEADSLYIVNNFDKSYKIMDSLFKIYKPINTKNYSEYTIYLGAAVMSGNIKDIDKKARYSISTFGILSSNHKQSDSILLKIMKVANLNFDEMKKLRTEHRKNLDNNLRNCIFKMLKEDKKVRVENRSNEEINVVDAKNLVKLDSIFAIHGFPDPKIVGTLQEDDYAPGTSPNIMIFFLHQPKSVVERYLPIFLESVKKGKMSPSDYAIIYDRMKADATEKQYYGSYIDGLEKPKVYPSLSDEKNVNIYRKQIGLPRLFYYEWHLMQFMEEYKK